METKLTVMEMSELVNVIKDRGVDPDGAAVDIEDDKITIHYQKDGQHGPVESFRFDRIELHRTTIKREVGKDYKSMFDSILEDIATYFERPTIENEDCISPLAIKEDIDDILKDVFNAQIAMRYRADPTLTD